jgi:hypothetical protein
MTMRPLITLLGLSFALAILGGCDKAPEPIVPTPSAVDKADVPKGPATAADPKNVKPSKAP